MPAPDALLFDFSDSEWHFGFDGAVEMANSRRIATARRAPRPTATGLSVEAGSPVAALRRSGVDERRGILAAPDRSLGGHRQYDEDTVLLLRVIKAAQGLGFTLDEVAEMVDAGSHAHRRRTHLADHARAKLVQVRAKITALQQIEATLEQAIEAGCDDLTVCALEENCPIPFQTIAVADNA